MADPPSPGQCDDSARGLGAHSPAVSRWNPSSNWPTAFPQYSEHWPTTAEPWIPTGCGAVVRVCLRPGGNPKTVFRSFPDLESAARAEYLRRGRACSEACRGRHVLAYCVPGAVRVVRSRYDRPVVPRSLEDALLHAGYHAPHGSSDDSTPDRWPRPSILNPPLPEEERPR